MSTVLVVEDQDDIREPLGELLQLAGFSVLEAGNGREALDMLHRSPSPCAILLDLIMPVMDGWTLLDRLRAAPETRALPVIVFTGTSPKEIPGATVTLRKPCTAETLFVELRRFCEPATGC